MYIGFVNLTNKQQFLLYLVIIKHLLKLLIKYFFCKNMIIHKFIRFILIFNYYGKGSELS